MAQKKKKKPVHTRLVLPGEHGRAPAAADRLGRTLHRAPAPPAQPNMDGARAEPSPAPTADAPAGGKQAEKPRPRGERDSERARAGEPAADEAGKPAPEVIRLPKPKKRLSPARRRRRWRRVRLLALALLAAAGIVAYQTGAYLTAATALADMYEGLVIAARPGDGWPMPFAVGGFIKAEPMGADSFAVLGERDLAIVSSTGRELQRVQHAYSSPGLSAGGTRAVLYSRGGREYTVEGRTRSFGKFTTERDILLAGMSPGGWLAVVTSSRFTSHLTVTDPTYNTAEPAFTFEIRDETPVLVSFAEDDRRLVLGCLSAREGALGSTLYLLHTGENTPRAAVRAEDARLLRAKCLSDGGVAAVYDRYAAVYDRGGAETARYDYEGRSLLSCDMGDGMIALVFGSSSQETISTVLLSERLSPRCEVSARQSGVTRALASADRLYLLTGREVMAFTHGGEGLGELQAPEEPYTVVRGGGPLLLCAGHIYSLSDMFAPPEDSSSSGAPPRQGSSSATDQGSSSSASQQ